MLTARLRYGPDQLVLRCAYSVMASPPAAPSLLIKVRNDLKTAMKAKDSTRLDVLRGLISDVTNAAKSSKPVTTDSQMLNIIRKRAQSSVAAAEEFSNAKREDLKSREIAQMTVLQEYMPRRRSKPISQGSVMKTLVAVGGPLDGQLVDKRDVAKIVQEML
ncbi:hypothetical protein JMJ35_006308 [Cladonia borealis]|uniref:Altered inheritance of mitochondria protein 41 n=1 Tax=Cladonia borealis TaxID=184061 RepID=A0AA39QYY2_9LECA|nr:hypothetical protein JMJ35_006308 [Cladonia borealis]